MMMLISRKQQNISNKHSNGKSQGTRKKVNKQSPKLAERRK